ncbi:hypothetical protein TL16_g10249, partial [Triparma laevis f. inornata]
MLLDSPRTKTYKSYILSNPQIFKDKVVLDVGCGTGILSMFCVMAGAAQVIAVDNSKICNLARQLVADNDMSDKIEIYQCKVEDLPIENESVDIIISEWMGYFLLYENMLKSVIFARDKFLKSGGIVLPNRCVLYSFGFESDTRDQECEVWNDFEGLNFKRLGTLYSSEPEIDFIEPNMICTNCETIKRFDLMTIKIEQVSSFTSLQTLKFDRTSNLKGIGTYFEVGFTVGPKPIGFSTAPFVARTHWKQTNFYLQNRSIQGVKDDEVKVKWDVGVCEGNERDFEVKVECEWKDGGEYYFKYVIN